MQAQTDYVKAIAEMAAEMPLVRTLQLYEFALFLKSHPLPMEESLEEIAADEALWDEQFAATSDDKLTALVQAVEADIEVSRSRRVPSPSGRPSMRRAGG